MPIQNSAGSWLVRSMAPDRSLRVTLRFDSTFGEELSRVEFSDHHPLQRVISYGVAFHEGALFAYLNQFVAVLIALAALLMAVSAGVIWWRRQPEGKWLSSLSWGLRLTLLGFCVILPFFGGSLLLIFFMDYLFKVACKRAGGSKAE